MGLGRVLTALGHSPLLVSLCLGRGNARGAGGDSGTEDGAIPVILPLVPWAHLPREGSAAGAAGGAGGSRCLPGAAERDAPRRVCAHLQLPGQSEGTGGRWDGIHWVGIGWAGSS